MVERLANTEVNSRRISHVETCFGASGKSLLQPSRVLVGEGVLTKLCRKKPKQRQFFLFNDILVYGNIVINKKRYNKQNILHLKNVRVEQIPDSDATLMGKEGLEGGETLRNGWLIISPSKSFAVYAQTAMEKQEWMTHMTRCIEEERRKAGSHDIVSMSAPAWIPDDEAPECMRCKKTKFTTLQRRHHCRMCGYVVCHACSTKKCLIEHQSAKPLRVCDTCHENYTRNGLRPTSRLPQSRYAGRSSFPVQPQFDDDDDSSDSDNNAIK
ncbi:pleckstrin homology domain-containing family F member 2-like isoform X2 [Clavelina lepadiformis]|uniref:pleckstrin homology domain-containing family F member 2-like isoform X2 n=1 Tax=Clavelina lepadiformis TaxID=159417 RepID=UPI004041F6BE